MNLVSVAFEDPRSEDGAALISEMIAFVERLYPEDDEDEVPTPNASEIAERGVFAVARAGPIAAGCGALTPLEQSDESEIIRMYVRPAFRGRRIADHILAALETRAADEGVRRLMLRCGPRQPEALRMYARNGYVECGPFSHHKLHPLNVFLEKSIA